MFAFIEKYALYGLAIAFALALAALGVQSYRLISLQDKFDKHLTEDATATAKAIAQAKALGERVTQAVNKADTEYQRGLEDAQRNQGNLLVDLNAGTQRVRTVWKCPAVVGYVPENAAATSEPSEAERRRNESATRVVGAADSCDAQVKALQAAYLAAAKTINGG